MRLGADGVGLKLAVERGGRFVAAIRKFVAQSPGRRRQSLEIRVDDEVGRLERSTRARRHHRVDRLSEQSEQRLHLFFLVTGISADIDGNDDVSAELARHVGRHVVEHAAIDEQPVIPVHRCEHAGNRHRRAHRPRQRGLAEDDGFALAQIGRDRAVRRRKIVEGREIAVGERDAIEHERDLLPRIERAGQREAVFQPELELRRKLALVYLSSEGLVPVGRIGQEHQVPVRGFHQLPDFSRSHSRRIGARDEAAHAGADDVVDRNVMFFEPLEHADVGDAPRAAATERQPDLRPRLGLGSGWAIADDAPARTDMARTSRTTIRLTQIRIVTLLGAQGNDRIDAAGAARRQPHGKKRDRAQNERHGDEDQRVAWRDAEEEARR